MYSWKINESMRIDIRNLEVPIEKMFGILYVGPQEVNARRNRH